MRALWLSIGWGLILMVIYLSLFAAFNPTPGIDHSDKVNHLIAYGTLILWFAQGLKGQPRLYSGIAFIAMGILIEILQPLTGREFSYLDMLANSGGVLLGYLIASRGGDFLYPRFRKAQ